METNRRKQAYYFQYSCCTDCCWCIFATMVYVAYHQDSQQAVLAFNDTRAKGVIHFHYGSFDIADEPLSEPETVLSILAKETK